MYEPIEFNYTLGVLSLDCNPYAINKTINSSQFLYLKHDTKIIIPQDKASEFKMEGRELIQGGMCITSMIDSACSNSSTDWVYIVLAGTTILKGVDCKISKYIKSDRDILFPVVDRIWNFVDGSINGLLINRHFHGEVGDMGFGKNLQYTKLIWADKAIQKGAKFKGIVGAMNL
jgi:hypothetical protein